MNALIRSELTKLTTTRTPRWVHVVQVVVLALAISGAIASGAMPDAKLATGDGLRAVLEHGGLVAILSLTVGITLSAGEFRHGTVVDTFLTEPRRGRVLASKFAAGAIAGLVAGIVVATATVGVTAAWFAAKDIDLSWTTAWRSFTGIVLWQALYTVIGVALGAVVRAQAAAVVGAVIWLYVVETAVSQLLSSVGRWLPATAARALGYSSEPGLLPQVGGAATLAAWAVAAGIAAVVLTQRRDLT